MKIFQNLILMPVNGTEVAVNNLQFETKKNFFVQDGNLLKIAPIQLKLRPDSGRFLFVKKMDSAVVLTFKLSVELVAFIVELVECVGGLVVVHPESGSCVIRVRNACK